MTTIPNTNWAKSLRYGFRDCLYPTSIDEVAAAVAGSRRVKVLGSGHSFNAISDGETAMVLRGVPLAPVVEDDGRHVSIAGHATYGDLSIFLRDEGLAVHNLASLPHISIAGSIATATHGSGSKNGNLATAVSALEIVTADGSTVKVKRGDPDFEGMVVHLGALGVVTRVTLDVRPSFEIVQSVYEDLSWTAFLDNLDAIMGAAYSVSVFTRWGDQAGQIWLKSTGRADDLPQELHGARRATVKRHPLIELDPVHVTEQLGAQGPWFDRLPHFKMGFTPSNGDEIQSEFHVPRQHGRAAVEALVSVCDKFAPLVQVVEFRAVEADSLWLSPQYKRDTLSIHFTWRPDTDGVNAAVKHVEAALQPFDALPHWGKVFSAAHVGARYSMLPQFRAIRDRMDPEGKFSNAWLDEIVFGGVSK